LPIADWSRHFPGYPVGFEKGQNDFGLINRQSQMR